MPPVPVRNALPLVRRKLPINSPSFKVWNELKPSSVIHPSSPFLRSCQPEVLRSIQPEVKAKKQILVVTDPDVRRENTKENSSDLRAVEEAGSDTTCENKRDAVVLKKKSTSENEACSESDTFVLSVNTESSNREENPKTEQVKECFPLRCPTVGHSTNSVIESVLSSEQSDNIVAQISVRETFSKEFITQNDEVSVLKTVSVHSENTKTANSAKPKIWNPLFHEPTHTSITRVPIETASMSKSEKEVSEVTPHFKHASWHQPSAVYDSSTSSQNISHAKEQSPKEEKSTHAHSITSVPSSKSSLHKFSIDSILSRVEKHHEAKDANEHNSCPIQSTSQNDIGISTEPDTIQASKRMRLDENQPFQRQSVIVATSSAVPSLIRTSTPVLKPTEPETPHIDDKENISASATPVFLWNIPTKAASKQPGPIVYRHPALVAMTSTNSSPNPKIPANVLLPILPQPSPIRSLKPTIGEVRNWNIPVPSQQMPSPIIVKQEPEIRNQIQVSPAIQMGPQHSPAVQITPHVAAAVPITPQIPSAMQVAPQVSPAVHMAPPILPAPPTSSTHISFQKQQQPKVGGIQVYDESNSGNVPIPLSAEVELVNGGFGLKNPSFRPPKPSDITNVSKDPVTGNGKYACSVCKKEFALQRLLNRHLKCHSDTKRFLCTFCGKGFNDTFDLKRHTRIHTGVKPYKCSKCERSFTQRCSLESHCRKVHNIEFTYAYKQRRSKIYVCEECGHSTDDPEVHYVHLRDNHPNNPALSKCHDKRQFKFNENNTANRQTLSLPRT
ncbi:hypothetical protein FSP39_015345 [Pinctada imbricata]|uniref:C2H2-type domain-containing protein n=1 Tax=Pinctada imbricata TaxID=66713 RepID=A0AA89C8Y5_PINIB|nr:hypothetical protein FSP39_015345 [Pinctada imbricata]